MKRILIGLWAMTGAGIAFGSSGIGLEGDVSTRYLRRGFVLADEGVVQGSAWLIVYGVEASVWGNVPLASRRFNEVDPSLGYRIRFAGLDVVAKAVYYAYPMKDSSNTTEVVVNALYMLGPAIAHTYHSVDLWKHSGAYYGNFGVNLAWPVLPMLVMSPGVNVGWASAKFNLDNLGPDYGSLLHAGGDLSLSTRLLGIVDVRAHGAINFLIPPAIRQVQGRNATNWNIGIGAAIRL